MTLFPAKILLFGEYSVLLGSSALGMPFRHFGASLEFINDETGGMLAHVEESNRQLRRMCDHFMKNSPVFEKFLDINSLSREVNHGLCLASTIPQRYGMGSSGALCAAVYDRFRIDVFDPQECAGSNNLGSLRRSFVQMESFFHGQSSGFDPLISSLKIPLLLDKGGEVVPVDFQGHLTSEIGVEVLLLDSGQPCSTGPLVTNFLAEFAPGGNITSTGYEMSRLVNSAIKKLLDSDMNGLRVEINRLSHFQLTNMGHLIPPALSPAWAEGLKTGLFSLKLCGSGGGGFLLCFAHNKKNTIDFFCNRNIPVIPVLFT